MGMFFVKRLIGGVVLPVPMLLILLAAALVLLWRGRSRLAGASLLAASLLALLVAFPHPVRYMARRLESGKTPVLAAAVQAPGPAAIVILGNGVDFPGDGAMPALTRLNDTARARLVEGVRLALLYPEAKVVACGNGMGLENCADAMADAAAELGVDPGRVIRVADAMDTDHEARLVRAAIGGGGMLLVTTAVHMERALGVFRRHGMDPIPAPCDFVAPVSDDVFATVNRRRWRPRGGSVVANEETWHEYLGLLYFSWFGGD
ncbi:MAG: YdcF family protein [Planctomycetota bacterium]|jgi:uncharacterized SAM-binding protein YcdF (DUF218 family)|nr:YdcF family protein [Planctomycetota bacterium]